MGRLGRRTRQDLSEYSVERALLAAIKKAPWFKARVAEIVRDGADYSPPLTVDAAALEGDRLPLLGRDRAGLPCLYTRYLDIRIERRQRGRRPFTPPPTVTIVASERASNRRSGYRAIEYDTVVLN